MIDLNVAIRHIDIPAKMKSLPISPTGFPIPWFVHIASDGIPDFRVIGRGQVREAVSQKRCWLCGEPLGTFYAFVIGPMCSINRVSAEPPSHLDCAEYAVRACPFLSKPNMRRNEVDMHPEKQDPAGMMVLRNPGVAAIWISRRYDLMHVENGTLFDVGEPERVLWFCEGRPATRAEVMASISSGLPLLEAEAIKEGAEAMDDLADCFVRSQAFLPAA